MNLVDKKTCSSIIIINTGDNFLVVHVLFPYTLSAFIACFPPRNAHQKHHIIIIFIAYYIYQIFLTTVTSVFRLLIISPIQNKLIFNLNYLHFSDISSTLSPLPNYFVSKSFSYIVSLTKKSISQSSYSFYKTTYILVNAINPKNHFVFEHLKPNQKYLDLFNQYFTKITQLYY